MTTTRIKASIGQKLIANANRYYTANIPQIIDELVQNARRAGATTIHATLRGDGTFILRDDGRGLDADKAPVLIRLGGSDNDAETETAENAAGVGFFSLAHCDVTVRSRDWMMAIPRDAFIGKADAVLRDGQPPIAGMILEITGMGDGLDYRTLSDGSALIKASRYSGLTLVLEGFGKSDRTYPPQDFLGDGALFAHQVLRQESHGLTIQLTRGEYDDKQPVMLNFFGKVITPDLGSAIGLVSEEIGVLTEIRHNSSLYARRNTLRTKVRIDVHDTSVLRLQLPERNALISDAGCQAVIQTIRDLYLRMLCAVEGANGIPLHNEIRARANGRIPAPTLIIRAGDEGRGPPSAIGISVPDGMRDCTGTVVPFERMARAHDSGMLATYLRSDRAKGVLTDTIFVLNEDAIAAYGENRVAGMDDLAITMKFGGDEHRIPIEAVTDEDVYEGLVEADIELNELVIDDAALSFRLGQREITIPICAVLAAEQSMEDTALVWPVANATSHEVVNLMVESLDWDNEDGDWKENRRRAWEDYTARIADLMGQSRELFLERLKERLFDLSHEHLRAMETGDTITLTVAITRGAPSFEIVVNG